MSRSTTSTTTQVAPQLLARAKPLETLRDVAVRTPRPASMPGCGKHQRDAASVVYLPIVARTEVTMLLDRSSGEPLDALPIDPW